MWIPWLVWSARDSDHPIRHCVVFRFPFFLLFLRVTTLLFLLFSGFLYHLSAASEEAGCCRPLPVERDVPWNRLLGGTVGPRAAVVKRLTMLRPAPDRRSWLAVPDFPSCVHDCGLSCHRSIPPTRPGPTTVCGTATETAEAVETGAVPEWAEAPETDVVTQATETADSNPFAEAPEPYVSARCRRAYPGLGRLSIREGGRFWSAVPSTAPLKSDAAGRAGAVCLIVAAGEYPVPNRSRGYAGPAAAPKLIAAVCAAVGRWYVSFVCASMEAAGARRRWLTRTKTRLATPAAAVLDRPRPGTRSYPLT